jgi:hypothetical protein
MKGGGGFPAVPDSNQLNRVMKLLIAPRPDFLKGRGCLQNEEITETERPNL